MEYTLSISQKAIAENFPGLDIKDAAIIDFLGRFSHSKKIQKKIEGNEIFYWFDYKKIATENPLLRLNNEAVRKRIREMCALRILISHPLNRGGKVFFAFGENYEKTHRVQDVQREENPEVEQVEKKTTGRKSRPQREENPEVEQKGREENPDNHNNHYLSQKPDQGNQLAPLEKIAEIETESNFTLKAEKENTPPIAPAPPQAGATRVRLYDPALPGVTIVDDVPPQPKTKPVGTGRGKQKRTEPEIHPENETAFHHFSDPAKARAAWSEWIRYKYEEHRERYKGAASELTRLRSLFKETGGDSVKLETAVKHSIGQLYKGIYSPKEEKNASGQPANYLNPAQRQHLNLAHYVADLRQRTARGDVPEVDYITGAK